MIVRSKSRSPRMGDMCLGSVGQNSCASHIPSTLSQIGYRMAPLFLFLLGGCIGHWHGRWVEYFIMHYPWPWIRPSSRVSPLKIPNKTQWSHLDDSGWHTIHVFYGQQDLDHAIAQSNAGTSSNAATTQQLVDRDAFPNSTLHQSDHEVQVPVVVPGSNDVSFGTSKTVEQQWFSQARQDELVIRLLRNKTNGYFVDLAANDAIHLSNTFALEKFYSWNGVCIEPNPRYWDNLSSYRNCTIVAAVVGARRMEEVFFRFEAGDHGGIANEGFNNGKRWQRQSERRFTVSLLEILRDLAEAPHEIDYLSLDVEGAESFIMENFPLDQYRIKIITAERLRGSIRRYLKAQGYEFVTRITRWGESLWIHSSYRDELDLSVIEQFQFPLF